MDLLYLCGKANNRRNVPSSRNYYYYNIYLACHMPRYIKCFLNVLKDLKETTYSLVYSICRWIYMAPVCMYLFRLVLHLAYFKLENFIETIYFLCYRWKISIIWRQRILNLDEKVAQGRVWLKRRIRKITDDGQNERELQKFYSFSYWKFTLDKLGNCIVCKHNTCISFLHDHSIYINNRDLMPW